MITVSIAVNKVDKSKFFTKKNGDKMLDLVLIETPNSKYDNDYMVVQGRTKEEREKDPKGKGVVLGNAKIIERRGGGNGGGQPAAKTEGGGDDGW
jgi:hypothetical protein